MKFFLLCALLAFSIPVAAAEVLPLSTNDTFLDRQWHLDAIHAREGWTVATGSRDVVVAVIDSGVDIDHEDLKENIWTNVGEISGNGMDDDGNGYVDDIHGWNFLTESSDVRPSVSATGSEEAWIHGTVIASLIAGSGNNDIGISGIAWRARILPLIVLDTDGRGREANLLRAIRYAVANGADIINLSLFGSEVDEGLTAAIREATAQGVLVVSAAGNSEKIGGRNLDSTPGYPACDKGVRSLGKLTVSALFHNGQKATRANYGSCVDISAPGVGLFAARPTQDVRGAGAAPGYVGNLTGTSVAAPLVSGLAALLKSKYPEWRGPQLARRIIETTDSIEEANPLYRGALGSGRINVFRALKDFQEEQSLLRFGPVILDLSFPGQPPTVRMRTPTGKELAQFPIGDAGDLRPTQAVFIRWQGKIAPDVAVTYQGEHTIEWRIYRMDGVLLAAGAETSPRSFVLTADDTDRDGVDEILLGDVHQKTPRKKKFDQRFEKGWNSVDLWPH